MNVSLLAVLLGLGYAAPNAYGLLRPGPWTAKLRSLPRSIPIGRTLMLLATAWFLWNLRQENISDFSAFKPYLYAGFGLVGVGCCFFVKDFLGARGFAVVLLLLAKLTMDTARWAPSSSRLLLIAWAYAWVAFGIAITVSPWRLRDYFEWISATPTRIRFGCLLRLAFGLLIAGLGACVLRN